MTGGSRSNSFSCAAKAHLLNNKKLRLVLSGIALAAAAWQLIPEARPSTPASSKGSASEYVDPAACAGCHRRIAQSYQTTGMGHSVFLPAQENTIEDYKTQNTIHNEASGLTYTMLEHDGKFFERRSEIGFEGKETNVAEEQIDFIIGSGNHARTYLHRGADGRLIELPVTWYTEGSGYWAMSPGYDRPAQEDFRRSIPGECMGCHNGFPLQGKYPDRAASGLSVFPKQMPLGIDCQRCHGPGGAHVRAALSGKASPETIRLSIVNPARLNRDRQIEVCMQCHLETSSSLMPNEIRRYSRTIESYRPGEPLGDYKLYFDRTSGTKNDRFEIAHAAYRLRMSACFRSTEMTCTTCHDPHQSYRTATSTAHYLAVCRTCHQSVVHKTTLPAGTDCLSCHMPKRRTDDVVHVVMTDHYIQRLKPEGDLLAPIPEVASEGQGQDAILPYYPPRLPHTPENELYIATAEVKHGSEMGLAHLQSAVLKDSPIEPDFYFELGDGYSRAGKQDEAIHWYNEALRRKPGFRPAIKQLAVVYIGKGQYARAVELLKQATAAPPADDALFADLGNAYLRQRMLIPAQQALEKALQINPEQPEAQNLLGLVAVQKGDPLEAEARFRKAIVRQPHSAEAHNNLGNVLAEAHKYPEAQYHFQKAVTIDPRFADARHSYGLMLALAQSYDQAVVELRVAVELDPKNAQTRDDLADILTAQGRTGEAADQYRQAIRLKPELADAHCSLANILGAQQILEEAKKEFQVCLRLDPAQFEANLGLGLILLRQGNIAEARVQCEKALQSPDPAVRNAAQNALEQMRR
jgi:predicted CXXCH cytochrome family protein